MKEVELTPEEHARAARVAENLCLMANLQCSPKVASVAAMKLMATCVIDYNCDNLDKLEAEMVEFGAYVCNFMLRCLGEIRRSRIRPEEN